MYRGNAQQRSSRPIICRTLSLELPDSVLGRALPVHPKVFHILLHHFIEGVLGNEHGHGGTAGQGNSPLCAVLRQGHPSASEPARSDQGFRLSSEVFFIGAAVPKSHGNKKDPRLARHAVL